jgi:hypothetical protein
METRTVLLVLR